MTPDRDARAVLARYAADLLRELASGASAPRRVRVADATGGLACLIQVWQADSRMPTAKKGRAEGDRATGGRESCRADVLAVVRASGRPLIRKEIVRALRSAGAAHGPGTVAKALADLTRAGEITNPRDKRGYRLPEWVRKRPGLFDET